MSSSPFIVLDRSTRRVIHQAKTLAEARGFSEARDEPTTIGIIPEVRARTEWSYVFQLINADTGEIIAESSPRDFDDAAEALARSR